MAAASALAVSGGVLFIALRGPTDTSVVFDENRAPTASTVGTANATRPLAEFRPVWTRQLGAPLYDPPPQEKPRKQTKSATNKKKSSASIGLRLIGTVLEEDQSLAIVADGKGNLELHRIGETFDTTNGKCRVEHIESDRVIVSLNGVSHTLTMRY